MSYHLGVDIGGSRVHAATARVSPDGTVVVETAPLGRMEADLLALISVTSDGEISFGDVAAAHGASEPQILVGGLRRRIGDDVPFVVGDHLISAEDAYARLAASVVETVTQREGESPARVVFTYPTVWGPYRIDLVREALAARYAGRFDLMPEAEAAARGTGHALDRGALAIYDLGETTFDAALIRREGDGWHVVGETAGIEMFGGSDLDDLVVRHVLTVTPTPQVAALRRECAGAKEALSTEAEVTIPVRGAEGPASVRLTRSEFEAMIEDELDRTVTVLSEAIDSAGVPLTDVDGVLLAGGSSRIPYVTQRISAALGRPVLADTDIGSLIAMGAARSGLTSPASAQATPDPTSSPDRPETARLVLDPAEAQPTRTATWVWRIILALLILAAAAFLVRSWNSDSPSLFGAEPSAGCSIDLPQGW
ncbi:MAG TPA: Hsp70 family protein [Actinomycetaceae bacterium]|nr:Hsp70 family protein [Actinomycetaceae bacterium]